MSAQNMTVSALHSLRILWPQVPAGMVYVRLIEASHVPRLDWYTKPSPMVKLFVQERRQRVSKVMHTSSPK